MSSTGWKSPKPGLSWRPTWLSQNTSGVRWALPQREHSVRQLIGRVVDTITAWGKKDGYFADDDSARIFSDELTHLLVEQKLAFNSPVWFNVGVEAHPQCSACFILSVDDKMESILDWYRKEGVIFKGGSGSGVNLSRLRSSKEHLSSGGGGLRTGILYAGGRRLGRGYQVGRQDAPGGQDGRPERGSPRHCRIHSVQGRRGAQSLDPD